MPTEAAQDEGTEKARTLPASKSGVASHRMATGILLLGLVVTGTLSWIIYTVNLRNEQRLLTTQTKETGTVLEVVLPALQTPLASAAEIAATSDGSSTAFRRYITSYVGPTGTFDSASLWSLSATTPRMVVDVGQAPILASSPRKVATFLPTAAHTPLLSVIGLLTGSRQRIGYAFASSGAGIRYVVYGESVVPTNKREALQEGSPFADLRYAVYLGRTAAPERPTGGEPWRAPDHDPACDRRRAIRCQCAHARRHPERPTRGDALVMALVDCGNPRQSFRHCRSAQCRMARSTTDGCRTTERRGPAAAWTTAQHRRNAPARPPPWRHATHSGDRSGWALHPWGHGGGDRRRLVRRAPHRRPSLLLCRRRCLRSWRSGRSDHGVDPFCNPWFRQRRPFTSNRPQHPFGHASCPSGRLLRHGALWHGRYRPPRTDHGECRASSPAPGSRRRAISVHARRAADRRYYPCTV